MDNWPYWLFEENVKLVNEILEEEDGVKPEIIDLLSVRHERRRDVDHDGCRSAARAFRAANPAHGLAPNLRREGRGN